MAIAFSYNNPNFPESSGSPERSLILRNDIYNVTWNYNLNTAVYDTYGGQVIQVLSVDIDGLTIDGQFGREGPFGVHTTSSATTDPRWGGPVPRGGFSTNNVDEQFTYQGAKYPGLYAMLEFFTEYFTVSAQGGDINNPGKFIQKPMLITYDTGPYPSPSSGAGVLNAPTYRRWIATPKSFPSFTRSNEEFAPLWKIECEVVQADPNLSFNIKNDVIKQIDSLKDGVGWTAENPWADASANPADNPAIVTNYIVNEFKNILPKITQGDLEAMVWQNISIPNIQTGKPVSSSLVGKESTTTTTTVVKSNTPLLPHVVKGKDIAT